MEIKPLADGTTTFKLVYHDCDTIHSSDDVLRETGLAGTDSHFIQLSDLISLTQVKETPRLRKLQSAVTAEEERESRKGREEREEQDSEQESVTAALVLIVYI